MTRPIYTPGDHIRFFNGRRWTGAQVVYVGVDGLSLFTNSEVLWWLPLAEVAGRLRAIRAVRSAA